MSADDLEVTFQSEAPGQADDALDKIVESLSDIVGAPISASGRRVACDRCGARTGAYPSFAAAYEDATRRGWAREGADDVCPDCKDTSPNAGRDV